MYTFNLFYILVHILTSTEISLNDYNHYDNYLEKYNKNYIQDLNSKNLSYKLGINNFTDWNRIEFKKQYLTNNVEYTTSPSIVNFKERNITLLESVDWRTNGFITDVKDQGQCRSCLVFSAIDKIEGQSTNVTKNLVTSSEQNLVDCSYGYNNSVCEGGLRDKTNIGTRLNNVLGIVGHLSIALVIYVEFLNIFHILL